MSIHSDKRVDSKDSEGKRMESLRLKKEEYKARKKLLASSFQHIDGPLNKKIKFGSDSDDGETTPKSKKSKTLFSDESDASGSDDDINKITVRPEFLGKSGQKLQELEAKAGFDPRFKMNPQFLDEEEKLEDQEGGELEREKRKQLSILGHILQKDGLSRSISEQRKVTQSTSSHIGRGVRFDPNQPHHGIFDLDAAKKESDSSSTDERSDTESIEEATEPIVPYFSMDKNFADNLKKKLSLNNKDDPGETDSHPKFSLLESLGVGDRTDKKKIEDYSTEPISSSLPPFLQDDSSDEEPETCKMEDGEKTDDKIISRHSKDAFFLTLQSPCVVEALNRFERTEKMEVIRKKWETYRPSLVKNYKKQEREAHLRHKNSRFKGSKMDNKRQKIHDS